MHRALQDTLAQAGVSPSNSKSYTIQDFTNPVKAKYGVPAIFNCEEMNGRQVVEQVVFCVDTSLNVRTPRAFAIAPSCGPS